MPNGSIARRTSGASSGTAAWELLAPSARGVRILEISVTLAAATASTYGLGRPAAKGITPTTPVALLQEDGSPVPLETATALAWGTGPTLPVEFFRRVSFPATIASSITWLFTNSLFLPAGGSLVLWNLAANGVVDVSAVVRE